MSRIAVTVFVLVGLLCGIAANSSAQVVFTTSPGTLSGLVVNGQPMLGPAVGTGGVYLIGSADGSDAQGRSVISVGSTNGYMVSDNPQAIPPPPFQLRFNPVNERTWHYYAQVGPVSINFETMSMPFDFGLRVADRFAFNGTRYRKGCTGSTDGWYNGSGALYSSIHPACPIHNSAGQLLGYVGVASTDAPTSWGEISGPIATVRITITRSSHYRSMLFYNHLGTHNIELGFGRMGRGETAFVEGDIIVSPNPVPSWTFEAERDFFHQIGRQDADGWSVNVRDSAGRYPCYGPYTTAIPAGNRAATYRLMLDNVTADNLRILTLDVYDATSGRVLASRDLTRRQFTAAMRYQNFELSFLASAGHRLEFRTYWHGYSYVRQDRVVVR